MTSGVQFGLPASPAGLPQREWISHIGTKTSGMTSVRRSHTLISQLRSSRPEASGVPNPNVMLEIGYARALKKPVLLLTSAPDTLPFDLRTQRALLYEPRAVGGERFTKTWSRLLMG